MQQGTLGRCVHDLIIHHYGLILWVVVDGYLCEKTAIKYIEILIIITSKHRYKNRRRAHFLVTQDIYSPCQKRRIVFRSAGVRRQAVPNHNRERSPHWICVLWPHIPLLHQRHLQSLTARHQATLYIKAENSFTMQLRKNRLWAGVRALRRLQLSLGVKKEATTKTKLNSKRTATEW